MTQAISAVPERSACADAQAAILVGNAVAADILYGYLRADSRYKVLACAVDDAYVDKSVLKDLPCIGLSRLREKFPPERHAAVMAIGYDNLNRTRESMFARIREMGYTVLTYIHPDAKIYCEHPVGEGCVVLPNAVIEPHARVGANSVIWCNTTIAHHAVVGDHCWIAAGAVISGQAKVRNNSFVGVNATIVNEVEIGEYNIVGAAALISKCSKAYAVHLARSGELFRYSSEDYVKHFGV
jgi:sugar O-acyltransferase (sialic acid O-acetyltransferase NeuD family)